MIKLKRYLFLVFLCLPLPVGAENLSVGKLTCEMQEGLVVVKQAPRLGWQLESSENGSRQTAYEIEIMESSIGNPVWSSGKVISNQSQLVSIAETNFPAHSAFSPLPGCTYHWRVRVWDESDAPSPWSRAAAFHIAPRDWAGGQWIGAITRKDARLPEGRNFHGTELKKPEVKAAWESVDSLAKKSICLRKSFRADKEVAEAMAYVCGLGFYEFSFNGKKVGDSEFAPLWSDYDKSVYYNTYDVTQQVRTGENAIGILLGNGFYNVQGGRYRKLQISFGAPTLLFKLQIRYTDGSVQTVSSDPTWKYDLSPITFNCIYGGEDYDARLEQNGWDRPGFDESRWRPVVVQEAPKGTLRPQKAAPVKIMERYDIKTVNKLTPEQVAAACLSTKRTVDPSATVLDMGQNLAGFPEIVVRGKRGQKITLIVAEALTEEGACNQRQTGRQHYYEYTLKGEGEERWHPRFSYYGFRYIQVEGAVLKGQKNPRKLPVVRNIRSCFVYNSAAKVSSFHCSNPIYNAAHRLIEKAVRSNMQAVFTDCPHREKLGWLEQVHLNGPGLLYNYDLSAYGPQIMRNMADAQHPNGAMPTTAPEYVVFDGPGLEPFAESPEWGGSLVIFPFMYYETYGDDSLIKEYYPNMRRYVDYLATRADRNILSFGLGDWYDYGDFRAGFSRNTPVPLVATAHYYMTVRYLTLAASMVGNEYDQRYYTRVADGILKSFNERFRDPVTGQYGTGSQCSNALPLFLDMVRSEKGDDALKNRVLDHLLKDIVAHGNRLTTGDVGNRYLIQTLARFDRDDVVHQMFNHDEAPGYGFQLKFGATTLTEQWDPRQGSSWNHFMMGQIDEWFFHSLAGIRPDASDLRGHDSLTGARSGYRNFIIAPKPVGDLGFVNAVYETLYGKIIVDWTRKDGKFVLNLTVPVNTSAKVYLPDGQDPKEVQGGNYQFTIN